MSRWFKTDLQIASPAGGFRMEGGDLSTPEARTKAVSIYVSHIKESGIEVFAVMDHNSTDMLEEIRDEAKRVGLTMFPGMELSTGTGADGVHLLLLGDPEANLADLKYQWFNAAGFDKDHPPFVNQGHAPSPRSIIDILKDLPEDTIAIAPHILSENGVASGESIKESTIKWQCLHHDRLEAVDVGHPTGSGGFNGKFRSRSLDMFPVLKRIAFVSTSDAYAPGGLGRHTWIRMHRPDLASLRQALLDYDARIFCDWDPRRGGAAPELVKHAYIDSISMSGLATSADELTLSFDPRITVIIGSRGSGKSTVVQAIRAVFGGDSALPDSVAKESERYQQEVFSDATITSRYVESISSASDLATWTTGAGTKTEAGYSLINVRVVTQKELFERTSGDKVGAQSPSANMLALVDEALDDDKVAAELAALGADPFATRVDQFLADQELRKLEFSRAVGIRLESERRLSGRKKIRDDLAGVERKLAALDDKDEQSKLAVAEKVLLDRRNVVAYTTALTEWARGVEGQQLPALPALETDTGIKFFQPLRELSWRIDGQSSVILTDTKAAIESVGQSLENARSDFVVAIESARAVKATYEQRLKELGVDLGQYGALQTDRQTHVDELALLEEIEAKLPQQKTDEADAWTNLGALFDHRRTIRQAFTALISSRIPSLRFTITPDVDHTRWRTAVRGALGFRNGDHVDALQCLAEWMWGGAVATEERTDRYRVWRDALLGNDYSALVDAGLTPGFIKRLTSSSEAARVDLSTLRADDSLDMHFLKESNDPADDNSWQAVTNGSPGQRSAAMLAFILSYGDSPLVLDQPEDDLDSALVSELIVTQFREARWKRQLIVVTHEANIPVNTDAERTIVLENTGGSLRVVERDGHKRSGPIDDPEVRKEIQGLLEGGVRAFVNRERRYDNELSKYRIDVGLMK